MDDRLKEIERLSTELAELARGLRSGYWPDREGTLSRVRGTAWALYWAATPPPVSPGGSGPTLNWAKMTCPHCNSSVTVTLS
jgi:phosphatidylglycerophosphatase A